MKHVLFIAIAVAAMVLSQPGPAADPFQEKLSADRQIVQALNRLTFGPRPGDVEEVRRIGLAKWMEQQLHPDQITENPVLPERLKTLDTLGMPVSEVVATYSQTPNMAMMRMDAPFAAINNLAQSVRNKVMNGTAEERTAALDAMEPEQRNKILAALPPNVVEHTPKYKDEAEKLRKTMQEERQVEFRRRNPQLEDLVGRDQMAAVRSGDKERVMAVVNHVDPEKRPDRLLTSLAQEN